VSLLDSLKHVLNNEAKSKPMKILFLLFPIHQYDGILHHTNHLAEGLIELGHTVDLKVLSYSSGEQFIRSIPGKNTQLAKNTFFCKIIRQMVSS